jgi:pimeloyl-ACP methyl ester carboxylesterase
MWLRFARDLRYQAPLIIPDLPGHGQSTDSTDLDYSIAAQVKYLAEFMRALSITRAHIIGNSMGGAVALGLAAAAPQQVASLILISAVGTGMYDTKLMERVARMGRNPLVAIESEADVKNMLRFAMVKPPYLPGILLSALSRARIAKNRINEKVAANIDRDMDQTAKLAQITVPSLIIWGDQDQV